MPHVVVEVSTNTPVIGPTEHLVWLRVPAAGGDGLLLGVVESLPAAAAIAAALQSILNLAGSNVVSETPQQVGRQEAV